MKCQSCPAAATVHLTDIVNGAKREVHLCQSCAEKQQMFKLNLPSMLQNWIGQNLSQSDELSRLSCPDCGIKYMEFRAEGRLGCPNDYEVFRVGLAPLLQRIHRAGKHVGKVPRHRPRAARMAELIELRKQLQKAVEDEAYEQAAQLRDLLREKEAADEPG